METLLKQMGPLAAVIAAAVLNIVNYAVKMFVPPELVADLGVLIQVLVMAAIIYLSNLATKFGVGIPVEKIVTRHQHEDDLLNTAKRAAVTTDRNGDPL